MGEKRTWRRRGRGGGEEDDDEEEEEEEASFQFPHHFWDMIAVDLPPHHALRGPCQGKVNANTTPPVQMHAKPAASKAAAAAMAAAGDAMLAGARPEGLRGGGLPPAGLPGPQQEGGQQEVGAAHGTPRGPRMTALEELDFLKAWDPWRRFLSELKAQKENRVTWRQILSHHTSTPCQPGNEPGTVTSLASAGLDNPKEGASGTWTVSLHLPHMFAPGDNIATYYDSAMCHTKGEATETACFDILALFLVSGCWMVKLPAKAFTNTNAIRHRAELLQVEYGNYHSGMSYGIKALLPTYQCVRQGHAPRPQPLPTQHRGGPRPPLTGESKDSNDAHVVKLLGNLQKEGVWHRAHLLPHKIWTRLAELIQPGELWEFFKRHPQEFEVWGGSFRWAPLTAEPPAAHVEQPPPAHGSGVGAQPLGSWFAVKEVHATSQRTTTHYGTSQAVQCDTLDVVEYRSGTSARHHWENVWCLVSIPPERELRVGEELCALWDGWCHQVTYVGPETTGSTASRHGRIIVRWDDHQETEYLMPLDKVWALQAAGDPRHEARLAAAK